VPRRLFFAPFFASSSRAFLLSSPLYTTAVNPQAAELLPARQGFNSYRRRTSTEFKSEVIEFSGGQYKNEDWCGRRDLNPHGACTPTDFLTLYDFRRPAGDRVLGTRLQVCGLDYTFTLTVRSVAVRR